MKRSIFRILLLASVSILAVSCGASDLRKTYPVKGTLKLDGQTPPEGILVSLHPQFTETDRMPIHPSGATDATGNFTIMTYNANDGAPEGEYVVTVEYLQRSGMSTHYGNDVFGGMYGKPEKTKDMPGFKIKVTENGATINLDLKLTPEQKKKVDAAKARPAGDIGVPKLGGGGQ